MNNLGEVLTTARRACGYTQEELAAKAGVTQAALSRYENDLREPEPEVLARLARVLGVTETFMARAGRVHGGMAVDAHMRRRQTAKPTVWRQLEARLNMYRMHASLMFEEVSIRAEQQVPCFDIKETSPGDAARMVRMQWRMPVGPVRSLSRWLEAAGILIIEEDFGTSRVDGLSQWIDDHPIILINTRCPTDRKRLTLAHELGHLVLHSVYVSETLEEEANEFAAEFLMPIEMIRPQLRNITVGRLHDLKREWGVSMQSIVERAYHAGLMTLTARTNIYKRFSAQGWRAREPLSDELSPEKPALATAIGEALADRGLRPDDVARLAGFAGADDNSLFPTPRQRLRALR